MFPSDVNHFQYLLASVDVIDVEVPSGQERCFGCEAEEHLNVVVQSREGPSGSRGTFSEAVKAEDQTAEQNHDL